MSTRPSARQRVAALFEAVVVALVLWAVGSGAMTRDELHFYETPEQQFYIEVAAAD